MSHPTTGAEIRRAFLDFFAERDHTVVESASLIPHDPSLLLTVAGMVPFKPYLLGEEPPPYPRAASAQKCIRTVDIDVVGTTARHMSFFEMLGNFSFGDYFKERAIPWAYELSTEVLGFDPERLWFTVHHSDDDAAEIWIDGVGVPPDRVQRRDRDNFWQMGVAGPAGLCSELFYDRGPEYGEDGGPVVDEERFTEFWNLVFMQYVQGEPYQVVGDLPAKSIDTGAGLERIAVLTQGVASVFDTDLLLPIREAGERATGVGYGRDPVADIGLRILADHGRALTFLIADGVVPSNEGRGYVLRRILRRAVRHAWQLGADDAVTPRLVEATVEAMGEAYPALAASIDGIVEMAAREESRFRKTLESGHSLLSTELETMDEGSVLPGETAFRLHDTYGFPVELTEEIAAERGVSVDLDAFRDEMEAQRARARAARSSAPAEAGSRLYREILDAAGPTLFRGYDALETDATILAIVADGESLERAEEGREVEVFFDASTFYGESGGQVGDTGRVETPTGALRVVDTQLSLPGLHGHVAKVTSGSVAVGQPARLAVDAGRREQIRKSHTGTHILHWALRSVVGPHATQAGSLVEANRLRFDFSHYAPVDDDELYEVERVVNERVVENTEVRAHVTTKEEAERMGAIAFFGEKYGDEVRVVDIGSYSRELCGGTHVHTSGQVGPLVLVSESSIGSNLRRVEALTGSSAYEYLTGLRRQLAAAASVLRVSPDRAVEAAERIVSRTRELEDRIEAFEARTRSAMAEDIVDAAATVGDSRVIVTAVDGVDPEGLRLLALQVRDRMGSGVAVLGSTRNGKGSLVTVVSPDLAQAGVIAADIAGAGAALLGGGASRDPELSQAGGPDGARLGDALEEARRVTFDALGAG